MHALFEYKDLCTFILKGSDEADTIIHPSCLNFESKTREGLHIC